MGYITGVEKNPSKQTLAGLSNVVIIGIQNKKSCKRGAYIREGLIRGCILCLQIDGPTTGGLISGELLTAGTYMSGAYN